MPGEYRDLIKGSVSVHNILTRDNIILGNLTKTVKTAIDLITDAEIDEDATLQLISFLYSIDLWADQLTDSVTM